MAKRKRKEHIMVGDGVSTQDARKRKRKNPTYSAGTDGAIEGQSPVEIVPIGYPVLHKLQNKPNRNK